MSDRLFIKPRLIDGTPAVIPDPVTGQPLKAEGEGKPHSAFWLRRLRDGDVTKFKPEPKTPARRPAVNAKPPAARPSPAIVPAVKS